jgi:hypothetical protein
MPHKGMSLAKISLKMIAQEQESSGGDASTTAEHPQNGRRALQFRLLALSMRVAMASDNTQETTLPQIFLVARNTVHSRCP